MPFLWQQASTENHWFVDLCIPAQLKIGKQDTRSGYMSYGGIKLDSLDFPTTLYDEPVWMEGTSMSVFFAVRGPIKKPLFLEIAFGAQAENASMFFEDGDLASRYKTTPAPWISASLVTSFPDDNRGVSGGEIIENELQLPND